MSARLRVVPDTNVVISALSWQGRPGQLVSLAATGAIELLTSPALLDGLEDVLGRRKIRNKLLLTGQSAGQVYVAFQSLATLTIPRSLPRRYSRDPDDGRVIACALASKADFVVTGDDDLLILAEVEGVRIRSVADLLRKVA